MSVYKCGLFLWVAYFNFFSNIQRHPERPIAVPMRPVEKQLQQMSITPKTQQVSIPARATSDQPIKQLSVPNEPIGRPRSISPAAATAINATPSRASLSPAVAPASKTSLMLIAPAKTARPTSPAAAASPNPFGDDDDTRNPFGDPDDYDESLNPFS